MWVVRVWVWVCVGVCHFRSQKVIVTYGKVGKHSKKSETDGKNERKRQIDKSPLPPQVGTLHSTLSVRCEEFANQAIGQGPYTLALRTSAWCAGGRLDV